MSDLRPAVCAGCGEDIWWSGESPAICHNCQRGPMLAALQACAEELRKAEWAVVWEAKHYCPACGRARWLAVSGMGSGHKDKCELVAALALAAPFLEAKKS